MAIKNVPGVGTLLGMLAGGTLSAATSEEDENLIEDTATSAFMAGAGATALKPIAREVAAFSGRRMDNFSKGAYDAEAIKPKSIIGKAAALVTKNPMHVSTAENAGLNVFSQTHTMDKLKKKIAEYPADDLSFDRSAELEYDKYKNWGPNNRNFNATPEEYRLKVEWDGSKKLAAKLDRTIESRQRLLDNTIMSDSARAKLIAQQRKAIYQYKRVGEANRKFRHEIAKNEVQALTWGKKWSRSRLRDSGYAYKGMYNWGDVKKFLPSGTVNAWENSMKLLGIKTLGDNRTIPVLMNTHRGDKQIIGKMATRDTRWLQKASYRIANYDIENVSQLNKWLKIELPNDPRFNLSNREVTSINEWWEKLPEAQKKKYGALEDPIEKYAAKMSRQIQQAGGFRTNRKTGLRGYFNMGAAKNLGVSTLYLEGGINANAELKPFIQGNKLQVASRIVKTDIQDLAKSAELGLQRRPPIIINQSFQTYNPEQVIKTVVRGGRKEIMISSPEGTIGRNVTKSNPFSGKYNWDMDLLGKQLERGRIRDLWQSDTSLKKKVIGTTQSIKKNPRKALKYATRAPLGKSIKAIAVGGAALSAIKAMSNDDEDGYPFK